MSHVQVIKTPVTWDKAWAEKRSVGGPGTRFPSFYHIPTWKSEHFKNSIFVPCLQSCCKDLFYQCKGMDHILFNSLLV